MKGLSRRLALTVLGVFVFGVLVAFGAGAAGAKGGQDDRPVDRVVMFASDGMRPDLMEKYAKAGAMPTYKKLMKDGATGDNGMLQAFPPNTGVGWYTMATGTYPSEHGSTNNTFFRAARRRSANRTSFSAAGMLQADTIANAAERAGKKVAQIDWVGGAAANINGPTVDFTNFFSNRGVLVGAADPVEQAGSAFFGVTYQVRGVRAGGRLDAACPRAIRPRRRRRRRWTINSTFAAQNPNRTYNVYFYDSVTGGGVNYDHAIVGPVGKDGSHAVDRPQGRRLPADQADGRQRPHRRARRPDRRLLHEADLARARPQPVQALRHLARARDREVRHARAPAAGRCAGEDRSRSTSPTTCCRGPRPTSRR